MTTEPKRGWTERANIHRIGDLEIAWWGRGTFVHTDPEAS